MKRTFVIAVLMLGAVEAHAEEPRKFFPLPGREAHANTNVAAPAPKFLPLRSRPAPGASTAPKITRPQAHPQAAAPKRSAGESISLAPSSAPSSPPATAMNGDEQAQQLIALFHPELK